MGIDTPADMRDGAVYQLVTGDVRVFYGFNAEGGMLFHPPGEEDLQSMQLVYGLHHVLQELPPILILYTNWRGERAWRKVVPLLDTKLQRTTNNWHKEPAYLLTVYDVDKRAVRGLDLQQMYHVPDREWTAKHLDEERRIMFGNLVIPKPSGEIKGP